MPWMQTYTGRKLDLASPDPATIDPVDIAHHLSQLCRYAGATDGHYSVAEHCCHIYDWIKQRHPKHKAMHLGALLHDAHEYVLNDIPSPVLAVLSEGARRSIRIFKINLDDAIGERFGIGGHMLSVGQIKEADRRILLDERNALLTDPPAPWFCEDLEPLGITVHAWGALRAEAEWQERLNDALTAIGADPTERA